MACRAPSQTPGPSLALEWEALLAASLHLSAVSPSFLAFGRPRDLNARQRGVGEEAMMPSCPSQ